MKTAKDYSKISSANPVERKTQPLSKQDKKTLVGVVGTAGDSNLYYVSKGRKGSTSK